MVGVLHQAAWLGLAVASVGFGWIGVDVYRRRDVPGATSFAGYCLVLGASLLTFTVWQFVDIVVSAAAIEPSPLLVTAAIVSFVGFQAGGLVAPIAWFRFVLAFTGQRFPTTRRTVLIIGSPVALSVLGLVFYVLLPLVYRVFRLGALPPIPVESVLQYLLAITVFYLAGLAVVGAALVGLTSREYPHLSTRGGVLLGIGSVLPWAALAIPITAGFFEDARWAMALHAAIGAVAGAGAVWLAVARYDFLDAMPAAGTIGRSVTIEAMNTPVLVVDEAHRVVDLNPAAAVLFDVSESAIGDPLATVLEGAVDPEELVGGTGRTFTIAGGQRIIEAESSELTDEYDRVLGHSIVCHDITDRTRREQRIQVLNRVLRHNLRNEMSVVDGYAELLESAPDGMTTEEFADYAGEIRETTTTLIDVGEKAREIESVLAAESDPPVAPLEAVLTRAVATVQEAHPSATVRLEGEVPEVGVDERVCGPIVRELVENGAEHNEAADPRVVVSAALAPADGPSGDRTVSIRVADNGPGIPDHELSPIRTGAETDLEHGSGLGLWLVAWGTTTVNGHVAFETDTDGTAVTVHVPPEDG